MTMMMMKAKKQRGEPTLQQGRSEHRRGLGRRQSWGGKVKKVRPYKLSDIKRSGPVIRPALN